MSRLVHKWEHQDVAGRLRDGVVLVLKLDAEAAASLAEDCCADVATCFVDQADLLAIAKTNDLTPRDVLAQYLPRKAHIRSGDAGEILIFLTLPRRDAGVIFPLYRWRLKGAADSPVQGVDLIGYHKDTESDSPEDRLILCEVKTRSKRRDRAVVTKAFRGVTRDFTTRLANQLLHQQRLLRDQGKIGEADTLARFQNPLARPYKTVLAAGIVHERSLWNDEYLDHLPEAHGLEATVEINVLLVEGLKSLVDNLYDLALLAVESH